VNKERVPDCRGKIETVNHRR